MTDKEKEFIKGLEKLTRETGIVIGGCGCCGSPYLDVAEITSDDAGYAQKPEEGEIGWIDPSDAYDWLNYKELIVK